MILIYTSLINIVSLLVSAKLLGILTDLGVFMLSAKLNSHIHLDYKLCPPGPDWELEWLQ